MSVSNRKMQNKARDERKASAIDTVYSIIRERSGKVRSVDLYELIGNREEVVHAITKLTGSRKIVRVRGLGEKGIEYFYHDTMSPELARYRAGM